MAGSISILVSCRQEQWAFVPALARRYHLGVEVGDFADPEVLEGDWRVRLAEIRPLLEQIPGERAMHGPRSEINVGVRDSGLVAFARRRCQIGLEVAAEVGAATIVFHTGYNPLIKAPGFDRRWTARSADFWRSLAEEAAPLGVHLGLENAWEPRAEILRGLVDTVNMPSVRACFDVGHANVYSRQPAQEWISILGSDLAYMHLHNNDGRQDSHRALDEGSVDFSRLLPLLAISPQPPRLTLEVSGDRDEVEDSVVYVRRLLRLP